MNSIAMVELFSVWKTHLMVAFSVVETNVSIFAMVMMITKENLVIMAQLNKMKRPSIGLFHYGKDDRYLEQHNSRISRLYRVAMMMMVHNVFVSKILLLVEVHLLLIYIRNSNDEHFDSMLTSMTKNSTMAMAELSNRLIDRIVHEMMLTSSMTMIVSMVSPFDGIPSDDSCIMKLTFHDFHSVESNRLRVVQDYDINEMNM